jgi:hypothetical protein
MVCLLPSHYSRFLRVYMAYLDGLQPILQQNIQDIPISLWNLKVNHSSHAKPPTFLFIVRLILPKPFNAIDLRSVLILSSQIWLGIKCHLRSLQKQTLMHATSPVQPSLLIILLPPSVPIPVTIRLLKVTMQ